MKTFEVLECQFERLVCAMHSEITVNGVMIKNLQDAKTEVNNGALVYLVENEIGIKLGYRIRGANGNLITDFKRKN